MNRYLISLLAASAMALSAGAGDLRQLIAIPSGTLSVTNAVFLNMPVRGNATANIDGYSIGSSALATQLVVQASCVSTGGTVTNVITVTTDLIAGNKTTQTTAKTVVGEKDSWVITINATNAAATYVLLDLQGY